MAKDPAFLFYSQDFYTGVATLNWEDRGKFITILCLMHQQGRLSEETIRFLVGSVSVNLKSKFSIDENGLWFNVRLEHEIAQRKKFTESRRKNGFFGGRPKKQKPTDNHMHNHMDNHMDNHMEDENENENENLKKRSKLEIFEELFSDDIFIEQLSTTHRGKDLKQAFEECYTHHSNAPTPPKEPWEWRQKLNTWLTIKSNGKQTIQDGRNQIREILSKELGNSGATG